MTRKPLVIATLVLLVALVGVNAVVAQGPDAEAQQTTDIQAALGTAFTYQGQLTDSNGDPVNDTCEFQFELYDVATNGSPLATDSSTETVTDGRFTAALDFGAGVFDGDARWLGIAVKCGSETGFTSLGRQHLRPAPYAHFAAGTLWSGLTGVPADIADGDDDTTYSAGTGLSLSSGTFSLDTGYTDSRYWKLGGNAGTDANTDVLGTTDATTLTLAVSDTTALRLAPSAGTPNLVGGYSGNSMGDGVVGATIGGGGENGATNSVDSSYGTVGGGKDNSAGGLGDGGTVGGGESNAATNSYATVAGGISNVAGGNRATVGGGESNLSQGYRAFIGGGYNNDIGSGAQHATIPGGQSNEITNEGDDGTIGGGRANVVSAAFGTIAGGGPADTGDVANTHNRVVDDYGTIGGGGDNQAGSDNVDSTDDTFASVGGGEGNTASGGWSTVGGGSGNEASSNYATVGGGSGNTASNTYATVGGGGGNTADYTAVVGGGLNNQATSQGATVPGGHYNVASGSYGFAAGRRAKANHAGTFVWADSTDADFTSAAADQFLVRASGGVGMGTNSPGDSQLYVQDSNCCTDSVIDNHIAVVENTSTNVAADVLALKANKDTPNTGVNFITFFDANGIVGEIEGDGAGGIVFDSASSDFAERLPKQDPAEMLVPGDIVGVTAGHVSKRTTGAERAMVVSTAPIVLGNRQPSDQEDDYASVAFIGQVPVKVHGSVDAGDYIVPSGRNDGTGVAISPAEITAAQAGQIVGRALESADGAGVTRVNTLVGLPNEQILQTVLARRDARIAELEAQVDTLSQRNAQLAERMDSLERLVRQQEDGGGSLAGLPVSNWLFGGLLLGGLVLWRRHDTGGVR